MKLHWLVSIPNGNSIAVASVAEGVLSENSAFSFQSSSCDALSQADALRQVIEARNDQERYFQAFSMPAGTNIVVHKLDGPNCSIIQNNTRVLYVGATDRLNGLPEAIEQAQANS